MSWSRWKSIPLDDPYQHVDDFRTAHLAEVSAQHVSDNRQAIYAVEDAALANLFPGRLQVRQIGDATRIALSFVEDGSTPAVAK